MHHDLHRLLAVQCLRPELRVTVFSDSSESPDETWARPGVWPHLRGASGDLVNNKPVKVCGVLMNSCRNHLPQWPGPPGSWGGSGGCGRLGGVGTRKLRIQLVSL